MKTSLSHKARTNGSVLLISLMTVGILGITLGYYLWIVQAQHRSVARSQDWNLALAHAEAGVEEALAQLNYKFGTNINRAANGWSFDGTYYSPGTRTLATGSYLVKITTDPLPYIYSEGYAIAPISRAVLLRAVKVQAATAPAFQAGLAPE